MLKIITYTLCILALTACTKSAINQTTDDKTKGIVYETDSGTVTDVYDSTPKVITADSKYHKYICEKKAVYAGAASHDKYVTYKKTFLGHDLVKFEAVGKTCNVIT